MTAASSDDAPSGRAQAKVRIGARLRAARLSQRMTIEAVADATGLTKGFISRLERDSASPSVASLVAVCDAIGLRVGDLFDPPDTAVVRAGEGRQINFAAQGARELLLTPGTQSQLEVLHSVIEPLGQGGAEQYTLDCDTEFVYVLAGSLDVVVEDDVTTLTKGDAMTFPGRTPHTWRNPSTSEPAEVLWVLSPAP
jgi:transcriptional regulator with XRE-family HTH domain